MGYIGKISIRQSSAACRGVNTRTGAQGCDTPDAANTKKRMPFFAATVVSVLVAHALSGAHSSAWANSATVDAQVAAPIILAQANTTTSTTTTIATSDDSMQMARTRELIAADHREIDSMAVRIKEMIDARYRADALHIKSQKTIEQLHDRIAELEDQLKDAGGDYDALLAERDGLNQQLNLMQAERDSAREDINVLAAEIDSQRDTVEALRANVATAEDTLADREAAVTELTDKLGAHQVSGEQLEDTLAATEDKLKDRGRQLALAEERLADARQQLGSLKGQLADLKTDRNNALDEIASLKHERDTADLRANNLLSERDNLTGKLGLFQSRSNDVNDALKSEQQKHAETRAVVASLEKDIEGLEDDIQNATRQRNELLAQKKGLEADKEKLTADLENVNGKLHFASKELENRQAEINNRQAEIDNRQAELEVAHGELEDVGGQLNVAKAELEDLNGQLVSANNEIGKLNSHIGKLDKKVARLNKDHNQAQASISSLKSDGSSLQDQLEKARKLAASQLSSAQNELNNEKNALQKQIDRRDRDLLHLNGRVSELSAELNELSEKSTGDISDRDSTIAVLEAQLAELQKTRDDLLAEGERATDTMENLHNLIASLEDKEKESAARLIALQNQYDALQGNGQDEVKGLQAKLSQSEDRLRLATSQLNAMLLEKKTLEAERDAVFSEAEKLRVALTDELRAAKLENVTVQNARADNSIPLRLGNADFFAVGSAELTKEGGENLKKLAEIISTFDDRRIVVEGHTDNVQIGYRLKSKFISNWELSVARAAAAVRHMQYQSNINPHQLSAVGYGEYAPVASNETIEGRQMNRRVEVVLYPREVTEEQFSSIDE